VIPASHSVQLAGPAGVLDCSVEPARGQRRGLALVAHPHPLHGGNRDNKVVQTLARALRQLGFEVWLPDFRGVRQSAGTFADGVGEVDDLEAVLAHARRQAPEGELVLAGFSFGAMVTSHLASRLAASASNPPRLILVGVATSRWPVAPVAADSLVIHGEHDDIVPLPSVLDWARPQGLPIVVVPGADHFFHGRLPLLKHLVLQHLACPPGTL